MSLAIIMVICSLHDHLDTCLLPPIVLHGQLVHVALHVYNLAQEVHLFFQGIVALLDPLWSLDLAAAPVFQVLYDVKDLLLGRDGVWMLVVLQSCLDNIDVGGVG